MGEGLDLCYCTCVAVAPGVVGMFIVVIITLVGDMLLDIQGLL